LVEDLNPEKLPSVDKKQVAQDIQKQRSFQPVKTQAAAGFHGNISYKRAKSGEIANSIERDLLMRSGLAQLTQQPVDQQQ